MKLQELVAQANSTYKLDLKKSDIDDVYSRMRRSGFADEVKASVASQALDTILSITDESLPTKKVPNSVYASLKVEAEPDLDGRCQRCKGKMRSVLLVGDRKAAYCQPCNITLPFRVEEV